VGENYLSDFSIPSWDAPVFLDGKDSSVVDFLFLGNSINFAFRDFETKQDFATDYNGRTWKGAFGMWASLKRSIEEGIPLLDAGFLAQMDKQDIDRLFKGTSPIPLIDERLRIFNEVGKVLVENYDWHFHNLVNYSRDKAFNNGRGIVDRLVKDFLSFDDSVERNGYKIRFDKRAQLAVGMMYGRFRNEGFAVNDVDDLTVFADYGLPKVLRHFGVLVYSPELSAAVDNQEVIPELSDQELEIRASTIHASKRIIDGINSRNIAESTGKERINALHMDYKLWAPSRNIPSKHHLTRTIRY
jgi:hypothetical protein